LLDEQTTNDFVVFVIFVPERPLCAWQ